MCHTFGTVAMESIAEALKTAGVGDDLLQVLENVGLKHQEAAAGPFANMDTTVLVGLNTRMPSAIESAQQQQEQQQHEQGRP